MLARFAPEHPGAVAVVNGRTIRAGALVEVDEATMRRIVGLVPATGAEAAAEFIAAVSVPTERNPETPVTEAPAPAPKRGRKPKAEA